MSDIFISYASEDRPKAHALAEVLGSIGWSVWWDRAIPAGTQFDKVIEKELTAAKCVVVLWSQASVQSQWVRAEAGDALRREVLIPALIEDVEIPLVFRQIQAAHLVGWSGDSSHSGLEKLVRAVSQFVDVEPAVEFEIPRQAPRPPRPRRLLWLGGGTAATLAAVGTLSYVMQHLDPAGDAEQMVSLPGGAFMMGSTAQEAKAALALEPSSRPTWAEPEQPQHRVLLDGFSMDRFEVSVADYAGFLHETGRVPHEGFDAAPGKDHPVTGVTWAEADQYCRWAGKLLPTEAQWEYAARGGESARFPWGDSPVNGSRANYCDINCPDRPDSRFSDDDGQPSTAPVGAYPEGKSAHGVYDLAGNAAEWVRDWYDARMYEKPLVDNPVNEVPHIDEYKVIRGGSYLDGPYFLRAATRNFRAMNTRHPKIGFRCVLPQARTPHAWAEPVAQDNENRR